MCRPDQERFFGHETRFFFYFNARMLRGGALSISSFPPSCGHCFDAMSGRSHRTPVWSRLKFGAGNRPPTWCLPPPVRSTFLAHVCTVRRPLKECAGIYFVLAYVTEDSTTRHISKLFILWWSSWFIRCHLVINELYLIFPAVLFPLLNPGEGICLSQISVIRDRSFKD